MTIVDWHEERPCNRDNRWSWELPRVNLREQSLEYNQDLWKVEKEDKMNNVITFMIIVERRTIVL